MCPGWAGMKPFGGWRSVRWLPRRLCLKGSAGTVAASAWGRLDIAKQLFHGGAVMGVHKLLLSFSTWVSHAASFSSWRPPSQEFDFEETAKVNFLTKDVLSSQRTTGVTVKRAEVERFLTFLYWKTRKDTGRKGNKGSEEDEDRTMPRIECRRRAQT